MIVLLAYSLLGLGVLNSNFFGVISNTVTLALFITMAFYTYNFSEAAEIKAKDR